jgi:hypothetical protein
MNEISRVACAHCLPLTAARERSGGAPRPTRGARRVHGLGERVGERIQGTLLVAAKNKRAEDIDLWNAEGPLHRVWARTYQGGSLQVVKLGPKLKLVETRGIVLNRYHYYRKASLAVLRAAHAALGAEISAVEMERYDEANDEFVVRFAWLSSPCPRRTRSERGVAMATACETGWRLRPSA